MLGLTLPLLTRNLIDNYLSISTEAAPLLGLIEVVFIVQAISSGFSLYLLSAVGQKVVANLREKVWLKIIHLPVRFFDKTSSDETVSRIINDTNIIRGLISVHFPTFIVGIVSILGTVAILLILDWKLTLILLIAIPFILAIVIPLGKKMSKISQELLDEMASFMGKIQQTISEIRLVKSSTAEKEEEEKGLLGIHNIFQYGLKNAKIVALVSPIMQFLILFVVKVVISHGVMQVKNEVMTMGTLVAFLLYVYQILTPVTDSAKFFTELQRSQGATKRMITILIQTSEDHQEGFIQDVFNQPIH